MNADKQDKLLDDILQQLPEEAPSRDLVAAAMDEAYGHKVVIWKVLAPVAAAAAAAAIVFSVVPDNAVEPLPTNKAIEDKISEARVRTKRPHNPFESRLTQKRTSGLERRIKRTQRKADRIKSRVKFRDFDEETGSTKGGGNDYV
ncbi:hypothetical protein BVX97_03585 [bacterium E08(2017)]|nr:hypothetical protein BVX97_03585 [bacterium E08(2017)]